MKNKIMIIFGVAVVSAIAFFIINYETGSPDKYKNFEQLEETEAINKDYSIHFEENNSDVLLIAIHGGGIEPGTTELTKYMADKYGYSYYTFNGIKKEDNLSMHITSTNYDEPKALEMMSNSLRTISFHGYESDIKNTYVGGLDEKLSQKIKSELEGAGFPVSGPPKRFEGKDKNNIANKNKSKKGVQLEISKAQREAFFKNNNLASENRKDKEPEFHAYVEAIQKALNNK